MPRQLMGGRGIRYFRISPARLRGAARFDWYSDPTELDGRAGR
jgi:hypothetical protein